MVLHERSANNDITEESSLLGGEDSFEMEPPTPHSPPSPLLAIITYFVFVVGQAFIATANIDVLLGLICQEEYTSSSTIPHKDPRCRESTVAGRVAAFSSYDAMITGILGVLVVPKLAAFSDKIGRKPILIFGALSAGLNDFIRILCIEYPNIFNYRWLLLAYVFRGAGGTWAAMQMLNGTYIADCTTSENRPQYLGLLDAFFFAGLALGPFLGSIFISLVPSFTKMFGITFLLDICYALMIFLFIKESRSKEAQLEARHNVENNHSIWNLFRPLTKLQFTHIRDRVQRRNAQSLVALMAFAADIGVAIAPIFMIFAEFRFKWTSVETGFLMTTFGVSRTIILAFVYPFLVKFLNSWWHVSHDHIDRIDLFLLRIGFLVSTIGFVIIGNAPNSKVYVGAIVGDSLAGVLIPTLKNSIIKYVEPANIGQVMGSISFLTSITSILSTQMFFRLFEWTVAIHPQLVFELASVLFFGLILLTYRMTPATTLQDLA